MFSQNTPRKTDVTIVNNKSASYELRWTVESRTGDDAALIEVIGTPKVFSLPPNGKKVISLRIRRPNDAQHLAFRVETTASPTITAETELSVVPDVTLLLPAPSIESGKLWPNARIELDTDHGNISCGHGIDCNPHVGPLQFPVSRTGPNLEHPPLATYAQAIYEASFAQYDQSPNSVKAAMTMTARVGGKCGAGASGGSGGVNPVWESMLSLPGVDSRRQWDITISTDLIHRTRNAHCSLSLDAEQIPVQPVTGNWNHSFVVPNGSHLLRFSCDGDNPYIGCRGHANNIHDQYIDDQYILRVSAARQTPTATVPSTKKAR